MKSTKIIEANNGWIVETMHGDSPVQMVFTEWTKVIEYVTKIAGRPDLK